MTIAVPYENGNIFRHFGHTAVFKLYEAENGRLLSTRLVYPQGSGHGALADALAGLGVTDLICGGIGSGARNALTEAGIAIYGGVSGDADEAVECFLDGALDYDPRARCTHHNCASHSCH